MRSWSASLLSLGLLLSTSVAAAGAEDTSVLVTTMSPRRGSLPDIVTAYEIAAPTLDSSLTISLQSQGRVLGFDVTAGEQVKAGQPLLRFAVSQSALGSFRQAETALQTARIDRTRIARLLKQQLATKDQLTQVDKLIADAQNTLDTLKKSGADKPDLVIDAPFDGVVTTIPVAQGDTLAPGAPMMSPMRADGLVVKVGIEPTQRLRVKRGDTANLDPLTAGGAAAKGKVVRIDGLLNPKTHLIDTDVSTTAHILPGAAYKADIVVGRFDGFILPASRLGAARRGRRAYLPGAGRQGQAGRGLRRRRERHRVRRRGNSRSGYPRRDPGCLPAARGDGAAVSGLHLGRRKRHPRQAMTLAGFAERHVRSIVFVALALAFAGIVQAPSVGLFPQVLFPRVDVSLSAGDRPADQTAILVTRPIEEAIRAVPGVHNVRSQTSRGASQISVDFGWGYDMVTATLNVDSAITKVLAGLPPARATTSVGWIRPCFRSSATP